MNTRDLARAAWAWLGRELDRWSADGERARFWWRDDDADHAGPELERLLELSRRRQVPLALAAIPTRLGGDLPLRLRQSDCVCVLQHGYAHTNHAPPGQRSIEIGGQRSGESLSRDLRRGREMFERQFGEAFVPVLVPPWNRIDERIVDCLPGLGFRGISTLRARRSAHPAAGLLQVNVHLDPIDWPRNCGFIGVYPAIAVLVQHLVARRSGYRDAAEPSGILSHHLVQNEATWRFLDDLLGFIDAHPAAEFIDARDTWSGMG